MAMSCSNANYNGNILVYWLLKKWYHGLFRSSGPLSAVDDEKGNGVDDDDDDSQDF